MTHRDFNRRFKRTSNIFNFGIGFIWVLTLLTFFNIGYIIYQISQKVEDEGLKGVAEQLWYGKQENKDD